MCFANDPRKLLFLKAFINIYSKNMICTLSPSWKRPWIQSKEFVKE